MKGLIVSLMMVMTMAVNAETSKVNWVEVIGEVGSSIVMIESGGKVIWLKTSGKNMDSFELSAKKGLLVIENKKNIGKHEHERHTFQINETVDTEGIFMNTKGDLIKITILECD